MGTLFYSNYDNAVNSFNSFFEPFRKVKEEHPKRNVRLEINGVSFQYRPRQDFFARGILKAIRDKNIYIVQAGVGIGKSIGYLIPIFCTIDNVTEFNKVIISTSNINLQHQLQKEIDIVSKMLNVPIKVAIAKGINNYACLSKIDKLLQAGDVDSKVISQIRDEIIKRGVIDIDELSEISDSIKKKISLSSRSLCNNCSMSCIYRQLHKDISNANIIITNHNYFVQSINMDRDFVYDADMFVFDEAHKLEGAIRDICSYTYYFDSICDKINYYLNNNLLKKGSKEAENASNLIKNIGSLFSSIRLNSSKYFNKTREDSSIRITDCAHIPLCIDGLEPLINDIIIRLNYFIHNVNVVNNKNGFFHDNRVKFLANLLNSFRDALQKDNSKNIYWVTFSKNNRINISCTCRNTDKITNSIFSRNIPIVCTSGTLIDLNGGYETFENDLGLNRITLKNKGIFERAPLASPYDFEHNSLFYYDLSMNNPKTNKNAYIQDLINKLPDLIQMTHGRCLILFTSKETMNTVYNNIDMTHFSFPIYMQGQASNSVLREKFGKNVKSCLFATGSFWEGVDIHGPSLSHVIITRLPFANVDAIMEAKSNDTISDTKNAVYLNDMLQKFAQGTGRLIRSTNDKGIITCLDPRIKNYLEYIKLVTPFKNFTCDIDTVKEYSESNIISRDVPRVRKKER